MSWGARKSILVSLLVLGAGVGFGALKTRVLSAGEEPGFIQQQAMKATFRRPENIPFPASNPFSEVKYQLGLRLFFDPTLSGSRTMACATCHNPASSWTDGLGRAIGNGHKTLDRKSPSILNAAWGRSFFWDGRADSLEKQALGPIQSTAEMNLTLAELVRRLDSIPEYREWFSKAFGPGPISPENIAKAIATFERTIVSDIAPFDRWIAGEDNAISHNAQRGFALFNQQAGCVKCHNGWNFTNGSFADIGLVSQDEGRGLLEKNPALSHGFKVPTLRKIAKRAPYMHDGSLPTLLDVIENYDRGGTVQRTTTKLFLKPLKLSAQDKQDLVAFLETLNSEDEAVTAPPLPGR